MVFGTFKRPFNLKTPVVKENGGDIKDYLKVSVLNDELCRRYTANYLLLNLYLIRNSRLRFSSWNSSSNKFITLKFLPFIFLFRSQSVNFYIIPTGFIR